MGKSIRYYIKAIIDLDEGNAGEISDRMDMLRDFGVASIVDIELVDDASVQQLGPQDEWLQSK